MKVLIIGNNNINNSVCEYLNKKGIEVTVISDVYRLRSVTGEVGNFTAVIKDDEGKKDIQITVDHIILTGQSVTEPVKINGLPATAITAAVIPAMAITAVTTEPVVFLLDYFCESPMSATIDALNNAVAFADNKLKVFYLAKFIRTAGRGIEELYKKARETGVTFIKYEDLQITSDTDKEEFYINASDGELDLKIVTKTVYADGGHDVGERFLYTIKKLGLTVNSNGYLTEDTFFLTPVFTSRRGVYHITRDLSAERLEEGLDFICTLIKSGVDNMPFSDASSFGIAVIDGNKCIFCYNCHRACPHAALQPDSVNNQMQCLSTACFGCGTCAGLCPANAIKLENDLTVLKSDVQSSLVICCENSGGSLLECTDRLDVLKVPCGGLIDEVRLSDALTVYDKIIVVVCPDDACRHFTGNKHVNAHVKRLRDMMESVGLSAEKVRIIKASHAMPWKLKEELHDSCRTKEY